MKASKLKMSIAVSVLFLVLASAALVLCTYALFSDTATSGGHLSAGSLDIGLWLTDMTGNELAEDGTLADYTGFEGAVDLAADDSKVFDLDNICPGFNRTAAIEVRNNQSTTAFDYSVTVLGVEAETANQAASEALLGQLLVTVTYGDNQTRQFTLDEVTEEGVTVELGTMYANESSASFTVKVEFLDRTDNNDAMNGGVSFDIRVDAVQATDAE